MSFNKFQYPGDINKELKKLGTKKPEYWEKEGENMALSLFKFVSNNVPAYKKFLKEHGINIKKVKNINDFQNLPTVDKENYLRAFEYDELFPNYNVALGKTVSATSGSTGDSFYFPRNEEHDEQYEYVAEIFLKNQFEIDKKKTLAIIGFAFGIWIGGIFTYKVFNKISKKYNLTLIPVGTNKELFLKSFKKFAPSYDQIILMGYPPFIKDILDTGKLYGINWKKFEIKILTAAEGYTEKFRLHLAKKVGTRNFYKDIINMYGTVEQGTIATENAFTNLIRSLAYKNKKVFRKLFPQASNIPTLAQYNPQIIYFEENDGVLITTGYGSSIPLIRYQFADLGGIIKFSEMKMKLKECGIDIIQEAKRAGITKQVYTLPFVYTYARADFVVVFRGANIYPGEIKNALDDEELSKYTTGKFTMIKLEDKKFNQKLEINIELNKGVKSSDKLVKKLQKKIIDELCLNNSEFRNEFVSHSEKATPEIKLWPYQDQKYFSGGGKQPWVKNKKLT